LGTSKCHYYSKLKGDAIYTPTNLLGLRQCVEAVDSVNMFDLVITNFTNLKLVPVDSGLVTPDTHHPPFSIDVLLPHVNNNLNSEISYRIYSADACTLLYNILSTYDWSSVYETTSVDTAVANLNDAVRGAMEQAIPHGYSRKSKFPPLFPLYLTVPAPMVPCVVSVLCTMRSLTLFHRSPPLTKEVHLCLLT
jgi:hypothetical protein